MKPLTAFGKKLPLVLMATAAICFAQSQTIQPPPPQQQSAPANSARDMAQPGTVNYVEGQASINNETLPVHPQGPAIILQPGNTLSTGTTGFVEVLLTPGAFLRLGPNSQLRLNNAGLASTQMQLERGNANIEVDQLIQGTHLAVTMNAAAIQLEKRGLYDFNAEQQSVKVLDGKANITLPAGSKSIGKGDQLLLASDQPLKSHGFDMKAERSQPLYVWSEVRSSTESQANVAIAQNVAVNGGWYGAGWYWNPYWSSYAFLPGAGFLYSPFGWGFYSPTYIGYYGIPYGYGRYGYFGVHHGYVGGVRTSVGATPHFSRGGGFHSVGGGGGRGGGHR
jgi:hypothetical protein